MTAVFEPVRLARRMWEQTSPQTFMDFDALTERGALLPGVAQASVTPRPARPMASTQADPPPRSVSASQDRRVLPSASPSPAPAQQAGNWPKPCSTVGDEHPTTTQTNGGGRTILGGSSATTPQRRVPQ